MIGNETFEMSVFLQVDLFELLYVFFLCRFSLWESCSLCLYIAFFSFNELQFILFSYLKKKKTEIKYDWKLLQWSGVHGAVAEHFQFQFFLFLLEYFLLYYLLRIDKIKYNFSCFEIKLCN